MRHAFFDGNVMRINTGDSTQDYEIVATEIDTPIKCLSWLDQVGNKTWSSKDTLLAIVNEAAKKNGWVLHPVSSRMASLQQAEQVAAKMFEEVAKLFIDILPHDEENFFLVRHIATQLRCQSLAILQETMRDRKAIIEVNRESA